MSQNLTVWSVARRPRWIAALVLALAVAGSFAALGQWQLSRSFERAVVPGQQTEVVLPLAEVAQPQESVLARSTGQRVSATVTFVDSDYVILSKRVNHAGPGFWVVGHAVTAEGASLAVAVGWAATEAEARSAITGLERSGLQGTITGRYLPAESPQVNDLEQNERSAMSPGELINVWTAPDDGSWPGVYGGYLVLQDRVPGLDLIDSPAPSTDVALNLLNIFYAVEWVIFAGFAVYLWYRLVKDVWEAETAAGSDE